MTLPVRRRAALLLALGAALAAPAPAALAAGATVTGDGGTPVTLGGALTLRHMHPDVNFTFAPDEARYGAAVLGPSGSPAAIGTSCTSVSNASRETVKYQGNGAYTVVLRVTKASDDFDCSEATETRFGFTINAFTSIVPPSSQPLLSRRADSFAAIAYEVPVDLNPGADTYDFLFAAGAVAAPDGGLAEPFDRGFVNRDTGKATISFSKPGRYSLVTRAKSFSSDVPTAWSPRIEVTVVAPFDLLQTTYPDSRGPSYKLAGQIRETSATGKVKISIAKGSKGKVFRTLGSAKIRSGGKFSLRFKLRKYGRYTLRYKFAGSPTVAPGDVRQSIRISKRFF